MTPRRLLAVGAVTGSVFLVSSVVQAALRPGFDPAQQPPSALALGDLGWMQVATFVVAGAGLVAGALGLRRTVEDGPGSRDWVFVAVFGVALVAGGLFPMDPAFGFPPGTPDGVGATMSWHAAVHAMVFPLGFAAVVGAGWSLARRYGREGRPVRRWVAVGVGPFCVALALAPNMGGDPQGRFLPLWAGVLLAFGWLCAALTDAASRRAGSRSDAVAGRTP